MAVHAHYPSNQTDPLDSSFQSHPILHQSPMFFNIGVGGNPRKRGREYAGVSAGVTAPMSYLNQRQQSGVSTGLRLSFGDQQQQLHQQMCVSNSNSLSSLLSEDFAAQFKQQRDELDQFLQTQGEQLRRTLADKRQRHYRALLLSAEETVARRLREKEEEMAKTGRRNAELEAYAAQLSVEAQVWQGRAMAQEATAASLQAQLQRAMTCGGGLGRRGEDGVSCGGAAEGEAEDSESAYVDPFRVGPSCKACEKGVASVVVLPCRHLCVCRECEDVVQTCPLCLSFKDSSIQVLLS